MLQQVTISTQNADTFKPLLMSALKREEKLLESSIQRTLDALKVFEERYDMTSIEFEEKFKSKEIEETLGYLDWWMEVEALHHLEEQLKSLKNAQFD